MDLLTVRETADMLKVNPITVRRYIAAGKLPAVKIGRGVRVHREAAEELGTPIEPGSSGLKTWQSRGRLLTKDDSLFNIIGVAKGADAVNDVSANKQKYVAQAYAPKGA